MRRKKKDSGHAVEVETATVTTVNVGGVVARSESCFVHIRIKDHSMMSNSLMINQLQIDSVIEALIRMQRELRANA